MVASTKPNGDSTRQPPRVTWGSATTETCAAAHCSTPRAGQTRVILGVQADRRLPGVAQAIERDTGESSEELVVGGNLAADDPLCQRERELHELPFGLAQQRLAQRGELVERFPEAAQHGIAAAVARFDAGALALGVALREGIAFERGEVRVVLARIGRWRDHRRRTHRRRCGARATVRTAARQAAASRARRRTRGTGRPSPDRCGSP